MKKVRAYVEIGKDGTYGVYLDLGDNTLNYGIHGDGETVRGAVRDFLDSYREIKEFYSDSGTPFVEAEFEFHYDIPSFLSYYGDILSLAGLGRLTGINQGQLSHYVTGRSRPTKKTAEKIQAKLREFGRELSDVEFVEVRRSID